MGIKISLKCEEHDVDLRRKINVMVTPRKDLPAEMNSPWSTKGPTFINNKNLVAISCLGSSCTRSTRQSLRLNSWLPSLCALFTRLGLLLPGSPGSGFPPMDLDSSNQNCTVMSSFASLLTNHNCMI